MILRLLSSFGCAHPDSILRACTGMREANGRWSLGSVLATVIGGAICGALLAGVMPL